MNRQQLEHVLRAAAAISGVERWVVRGSQAVLGQFPDAPPELLVSDEVDMFSVRDEADSTLIDGTIGELSPFHRTFGYYAHGVGPQTAVLPSGWQDRLVCVQGPGAGNAVGLCLEVNDLAVAKLAAGREKDQPFVRALLAHGLAQRPIVEQRLTLAPLSPEQRSACRARLDRLSKP
jgi:hypothetical protein